jgi:hypothetical protein
MGRVSRPIRCFGGWAAAGVAGVGARTSGYGPCRPEAPLASCASGRRPGFRSANTRSTLSCCSMPQREPAGFFPISPPLTAAARGPHSALPRSAVALTTRADKSGATLLLSRPTGYGVRTAALHADRNPRPEAAPGMIRSTRPVALEARDQSLRGCSASGTSIPESCRLPTPARIPEYLCLGPEQRVQHVRNHLTNGLTRWANSASHNLGQDHERPAKRYLSNPSEAPHNPKVAGSNPAPAVPPSRQGAERSYCARASGPRLRRAIRGNHGADHVCSADESTSSLAIACRHVERVERTRISTSPGSAGCAAGGGGRVRRCRAAGSLRQWLGL